jgi:hypothetical protein
MSDLLGLVASEMRVSRRTVQRWCAAGKVPGAYRTKGGHWRVRKPRGRFKKVDKIAELVMRHFLESPRPLRRLSRRERWELRLADLQWRLADQGEKLASSPEFNHALEFSKVLTGVTDDDMREITQRDPAERWRRIMELKERDEEKWRFLFKRPFFEVHPRAGEAATQPHHMLALKAQKLRLNLRPVTPGSLARELKISVATCFAGQFFHALGSEFSDIAKDRHQPLFTFRYRYCFTISDGADGML